MDPYSPVELEQICAALLRAQGGEALVLCVEQDGRMEVISLRAPGCGLDISALLRQAAQELEDGSGIPLGNHLGEMAEVRR